MEAEDFRKGIYMFTSEQYLARAFEYGDLAKTTTGSNERKRFAPFIRLVARLSAHPNCDRGDAISGLTTVRAWGQG